MKSLESTIQEIASLTAESIADTLRNRFQDFQPTRQQTFSEAEAAEFLKVSKATVQNWRKKSLINFVELPTTGARNQRYVYRIEDLQEFLSRFAVKQIASRRIGRRGSSALVDFKEGVH